ncbi:zinc finger protein 862-like [Saccostrea cucullata]|uniref:zinc finger protein 862-like n=1 Tax=Saccostrea cuccullata TaxID=36930 RepID=UPI002ECFE260
MASLDEKKGIDVGQTYRNVNSCKEFLVSIAAVERKKIEHNLRDAKFCTIMSDGSTDVSVIENEIVYVHFALKGKIHCYFLGLIECEHANAEGIFDAIFKAVDFEDIPKSEMYNKIIAFAGDGASVNTGEINGVISHFRRNINSNILMIKCVSHRIELAFKDAMKSSTLYNKIFDMLGQLFKFYHNSPKQMAGLKSAAEACKKSLRHPTRVGGTRWVGHVLTALKNLLIGYKVFITHLEQVASVRSQSSAQSKAKFFLKLLKSKDVITFAHFLIDVLTVISSMSMALQKRGTCVYEVHRQLELTATNLRKLETRPGLELRKIMDCDEFHGVSFSQLTGDTSTSQMPKVISALIVCIQKRFSDIDAGIFKCTTVVQLDSWPSDYQEATEFGDEAVSAVLDYYHDNLAAQNIETSLVEIEWTQLKHLLCENHTVKEMDWIKINELYHSQCSNILAVFDLMLSLPAGTSECERGFSQMAIVKSKYRNRLHSTTMTLLMTVDLH